MHPVKLATERRRWTIKFGAWKRRLADVVLAFDGQHTGPFTTITENAFALNWVGYGNKQSVVRWTPCGSGDTVPNSGAPWTMYSIITPRICGGPRGAQSAADI